MRTIHCSIISLLLMCCVGWSLGVYAEETKKEEATSEEQALFDAACKENTAKSYGNYLKQYPEGKFASEAKLKIETLQWERAVKFNYITVFEQYLKDYPNGKFVSEAKEKIKQIEEIRCPQDIDNFLTSYETHYKDSVAPAHIKYIASTSALDIAMAGVSLAGAIGDIKEKEATWEHCHVKNATDNQKERYAETAKKVNEALSVFGSKSK